MAHTVCGISEDGSDQHTAVQGYSEGVAQETKTVDDLMKHIFVEVFENPVPFAEEMKKIPIPKDLASHALLSLQPRGSYKPAQ